MADLRGLNQVIVESIQSGLVTTDAEGRILFVNRFAETILGRSADSLRGTPVTEVFGIAAAAAERAADARGQPRARAARVSYAIPSGRRSTWASR